MITQLIPALQRKWIVYAEYFSLWGRGSTELWYMTGLLDGSKGWLIKMRFGFYQDHHPLAGQPIPEGAMFYHELSPEELKIAGDRFIQQFPEYACFAHLFSKSPY